MGDNAKILERRDFFIKYLTEKGFKNHDGLYSSGFVIFKFIFSGKMISVKDANPDHIRKNNVTKEFTDIVVCITPCDKNEADVFYKLMGIEIKIIGSRAYKRIRQTSRENSIQNG